MSQFRDYILQEYYLLRASITKCPRWSVKKKKRNNRNLFLSVVKANVSP